MIKISDVDDTHFWCHSCFKKNEVKLFCVSIEMPMESETIEVANFRLCQNCLDELQTKILAVI